MIKTTSLNVREVRKYFPILNREINGKPLIYLDSTATSLKPIGVLQKLEEYYTKYSANIFRGIYTISEEATAEYENARKKVADFIKSADPDEVIFTRNTTESINLVMYGFALPNFLSGDRIVSTSMEHHSNFVPWQQWAERFQGEVVTIPTTAEGNLDLTNLDTVITRKTKLFTFTAVSNVTGTINPVKEIIAQVKKLHPQCLVLVDAAQAAPHMEIDVVDWGADFVAFSGHKMLGPTGIGVLWGRRSLLEQMTPFLYGGEMIREVSLTRTIFKEIPHKFEAGTPHIAGVIGLGAALDFLTCLGMKEVRRHEEEITEYALKKLSAISDLTIYGPRNFKERGGVISFTMAPVHPHDIAQVLNEDNICIRSGTHCAMPLHTQLGISATARASFYIYTTKEEIDALYEGLVKVKRMFS